MARQEQSSSGSRDAREWAVASLEELFVVDHLVDVLVGFHVRRRADLRGVARALRRTALRE
jgi:hypothetical protein